MFSCFLALMNRQLVGDEQHRNQNEVARAYYKAVGFREYSLELEIPASERNTQQSATL